MERHPVSVRYESAQETLHVGEGAVVQVVERVWEYRVHKTPVVTKWFNYRQSIYAGDKKENTSPLVDIMPSGWQPHFTVELVDLLNVLTLLVDLEPTQADLLDRIVAGDLIVADEVAPPTELEKAKPDPKHDSPSLF